MKQNQFEFKPFDQVLVRDDDNQRWRIDIYSHYENHSHRCLNSTWHQCIPYDKNTARLLGIDQPYLPPQPKEYYVSWGPDSEMEQTEFTADEFERFIKTTVINNKDVSNFMVRRIQ